MSPEDYKNMSHQYFYENFFLINGQKPPPLTDFDKQLFAAMDEQQKSGGHLVWHKTRGGYRLSFCAEQKALKAIERYTKQ